MNDCKIIQKKKGLPFGSLELLFRINKLSVRDVFQHFFQIFPGKIICHGKVHVQIVSAVLWSGTWNLPFKICDKGEHFSHQGHNIPGRIFAGKDQIETGAASHGTEIDRFVRPGS